MSNAIETDDDLLNAVVAAAADFTVAALSGLPRHLADRLSGASKFVVVSFAPPAARLVVQAPGGETACIARRVGLEISDDLCVPICFYLASAVERLAAGTRQQLGQLLEAGVGRVGVLVELDCGAVHLVFDAGDRDGATILATLKAPLVTH
jgi:hypothetical protein